MSPRTNLCPQCDLEEYDDDQFAAEVCDNCAERAYDAQQERLMETGGGPSLIEQQRAAYKIKHGLPS